MPSASDAFAADPALWVIEPRQHSTFARVRELWSYRYLWWFFASALVKSLYRGSMLGWLWLLIRVVAPVGLNAMVFGGMLDQAQESLSPLGLFQIQQHRALAAIDRVALRAQPLDRRLVALDRNHIGAQVGKMHGAERAGTEAGNFDNSDP